MGYAMMHMMMRNSQKHRNSGAGSGGCDGYPIWCVVLLFVVVIVGAILALNYQH